MPTRAFLDANVIFSAALGGESFRALWDAFARGELTFCTSPQCVEEARRNVMKKRPDLEARLVARLQDVVVTDAPGALVEWATGLLPDDDAWVLAGAVAAGAEVLLTGNTRHFGVLMARNDLPLRVCTVRAYLDGLSTTG